MVPPIVTFVFAAGVAFLVFQTGGIETGMSDEGAPVPVYEAPAEEPAEEADEPAEEPAEEAEESE